MRVLRNQYFACIMSQTRKIIHVDMDAFFASVEQRDQPSLRGKPLVVGGDGRRSVVAAASYEARAYGIYSAMPMTLAKYKCPHLTIVPHRFAVYKEVSQQIRKIFFDHTDLVEPLSLDEAYLDVTINKKSVHSATQIAREIKSSILEQVGLTATAGISVNKFLAKVASDLHKPDGLTVIKPDQIAAFVRDLPIEKFFGVGKMTLKRMHDMEVFTGGDLQRYSEIELARIFGKSGRYYYRVCRGLDDRPVKPSRIRKSVSVERTFEVDLTEQQAIIDLLKSLTKKLVHSIWKLKVKGKTVQIKWRYPDFITPTRSKTFQEYLDDQKIIFEAVVHLAREHIDCEKGVRLLGVGLSNLNTEITNQQLSLDI